MCFHYYVFKYALSTKFTKFAEIYSLNQTYSRIKTHGLPLVETAFISIEECFCGILRSETSGGMCSVKKKGFFGKIAQNSQENICATASF